MRIALALHHRRHSQVLPSGLLRAHCGAAVTPAGRSDGQGRKAVHLGAQIIPSMPCIWKGCCVCVCVCFVLLVCWCVGVFGWCVGVLGWWKKWHRHKQGKRIMNKEGSDEKDTQNFRRNTQALCSSRSLAWLATHTSCTTT